MKVRITLILPFILISFWFYYSTYLYLLYKFCLLAIKLYKEEQLYLKSIIFFLFVFKPPSFAFYFTNITIVLSKQLKDFQPFHYNHYLLIKTSLVILE